MPRVRLVDADHVRRVIVERRKPLLSLRHRPVRLHRRHVVIGLRRLRLERPRRVHRRKARRPERRQRFLDPRAHLARDRHQLLPHHEGPDRLQVLACVRQQTRRGRMILLDRLEHRDRRPARIDLPRRRIKPFLLRLQLPQAHREDLLRRHHDPLGLQHVGESVAPHRIRLIRHRQPFRLQPRGEGPGFLDGLRIRPFKGPQHRRIPALPRRREHVFLEERRRSLRHVDGRLDERPRQHHPEVRATGRVHRRRLLEDRRHVGHAFPERLEIPLQVEAHVHPTRVHHRVPRPVPLNLLRPALASHHQLQQIQVQPLLPRQLRHVHLAELPVEPLQPRPLRAHHLRRRHHELPVVLMPAQRHPLHRPHREMGLHELIRHRPEPLPLRSTHHAPGQHRRPENQSHCQPALRHAGKRRGEVPRFQFQVSSHPPGSRRREEAVGETQVFRLQIQAPPPTPEALKLIAPGRPRNEAYPGTPSQMNPAP